MLTINCCPNGVTSIYLTYVEAEFDELPPKPPPNPPSPEFCEVDVDWAFDAEFDCWLPMPPPKNCGERATRACSGSSTTIKTTNI